MELTQARYVDVTAVSVSGRIDHANAEQFRSELFEVLGEDISSAGLRVLMLAARRAKMQDGTVVICGMQPVVQEVFEITRFNLVFQTHGTLAEAVGALSPEAAKALDAG